MVVRNSTCRVAVGSVGRGAHLLGRDPPPQHRRSNVGIPGLFLSMDPDVIAINVFRWLFFHRRIEMKADAPLQLFLKTLRRPAVLQEQELEPGAFPVLAQLFALTENLSNALQNRDHLVPLHKSIEPKREMRIGRKPAAHAQRETDFGIAADRGETHIIDFRIGAPDAASCNADFEFARQVVEIAVAHEEAVGFERQRRGIANLVGIHAGERAAGDVAGIVSAGAHGGQTGAPQSVQQLGQVLDRYPVQLNVLPHSEVGASTGIFLGDVGNGSQLVRVKQAIGNADPHHEERQRLAFAVLAADHSGAVPLRVHAPPAEICAQPFRRDGIEAFAGELADVVEAFPGILLPLQPLDPLRFRFCRCICHRDF